jgi:hypothetical protein
LTPDPNNLIDYRDVDGHRHNVSHYLDSIGSIRNILQEAEEDGWNENLEKRIENEKRQRKLAMQSLHDEICDLEGIEEQFGGENR